VTSEKYIGLDVHQAERIAHIREGARFMGNASPELVDQVGEVVNAPAAPFQLVPEFRYLHRKGCGCNCGCTLLHIGNVSSIYE
jgi:hypothetical protein